MRDLWYPGVSVASVPEAPAGASHQGFRARTSLPTLVKHRIKDAASSSKGREWQNASDPKTQSDARKSSNDKLHALHKRQAPVVAKETTSRSPATSLPEVSVGQPQESGHPGPHTSRNTPTCDIISEDVEDGCTECSSPANDVSSSCSSSAHDTTTIRAGRLSVLVSEGLALNVHNTYSMCEHSAEDMGAKNTALVASKPRPFQRTKMRKEKLSEVCSNTRVHECGPTAGVPECSATAHATDCVGPDSGKHGRSAYSSDSSPVPTTNSCISGGECGAVQSSRSDPTCSSNSLHGIESGLTHSIQNNSTIPATVCSGERGAVITPQLQQKPSLTCGDPESVVENKKVTAKTTQPPTTEPAIDRLLSFTNSRSNAVPPASTFCGWLWHEPALQRDAIFATRKEDPPPPRRSSKSSIRRKVSSTPVFRHYDTVAEYMVEYLQHHSFTYSTVRVYRPPPKLFCAHTEDYSEVREMPENTNSGDADHEGYAVPVTSPPKAKGKNWICLVKPTPPSINQTLSDLVLTMSCRCTSRGIESGAGEEEEEEKDRITDEATAVKQEKDQGQVSCGSLAASRRPPLSVVPEEVGHTSSEISINKYLIVHSQKDQVTATQPKDTVEVGEDEMGGSMSQEVDPCDSSIQVCDSGPSLTDSVTSLGKGKDMQNVYKFPQFQPVSKTEKPKQREDPRTFSSKQTIISKARSLGLVSHYVLHEKKLRDLLDQCVWQERTTSSSYGKRTASRERSRRNPDKTKEPRTTPSQRGLSAAVRVYTAQMGANWAATSREQSLPSREKSCPPRERACVSREKSCPPRGKSCVSREKSCPPREKSCVSREKSCPPREKSCLSREKSCPSRQKSCRSQNTRRSSHKRDHSAAKCNHCTTPSTLRPSDASCTLSICTAPSPAPPSATDKVSATSIFIRRRSAATGRTRAFPVVPEQSPAERRAERRDRAKTKRIISAVPQSTLRIQKMC